jgi:methylenetetrahydrofolate dehydrogenase (NADP+)/methenyltetrahydrofolate cyclohydrolase
MSFRDGRKPNFVGCSVGWPVGSSFGRPAAPALDRVNRSGVHKHDRDIVLNGVNAAADTAFQTLPVRVQDDRLFTDRADQYVQQILRDHRDIIVMLGEVMLHVVILHDAAGIQGQLLTTGNTGECDAIESPFYSLHRQRGEMTARILDGTKIAAEIRAEVTAQAKVLASSGVRPGLAVVLVGHNPASEVYVRGKVKSSLEVGLYSEQHTPSESSTTEELLALVADLNRRDEIDGILVQLPLPAHVDAKKVLLAVDPAKDVDGFHPMNVGYLSTQRPGLVPCTPAGVMEVLRRSGIPVAGQEAVVIGRSDIVGKPVAMLLLNQNATVTVCHSKTRDLPEVCRRADILVAAIGRAGMVTRDYVKPGATVIDVGINKITDQKEFDRFFSGNKKREESFLAKGSTLVGDAHPEVAEIAGAITPVPGGIGPLTIAMLMANTVKAAILRREIRHPELNSA